MRIVFSKGMIRVVGDVVGDVDDDDDTSLRGEVEVMIR